MTAVANSRAVGCSSRAAEKGGGKPVCGRKHATTMNQTDRIGQLLQKLVAGTHRDVSQCFPSRCLALLDQVSSEMPGPPASESLWKTGEGSGGGKPFAQGWTHTHTLYIILYIVA